MKILYTYNGLIQKVGGVSRYFYELYKRLYKKHTIHIESFYLTNDYFKKLLNFHSYGLSVAKRSIRLRIAIEDFYQFFYVKLHKFDIIHDTGESAKLHRFTNRPIVVTVHDMVPELFYQADVARHKRRFASFINADAIICVSENTKKDLLQLYPILATKPIRVIYHGHEDKLIQYKRLIQYDYILYVGSRYAEYKNFLFMLDALHGVLLTRNIKLLCTGSSFTKEERLRISRLNLDGSVECLGFVSDTELANLYHYALCFVYPSKYEGFGIPILEAFSHSCPACISNSSCFPEVAGDAAIYFNPNDSAEIRNAVLKLVDSEELRMNMVEKGRVRLTSFSWDKAAKLTESFYAELLK